MYDSASELDRDRDLSLEFEAESGCESDCDFDLDLGLDLCRRCEGVICPIRRRGELIVTSLFVFLAVPLFMLVVVLVRAMILSLAEETEEFRDVLESAADVAVNCLSLPALMGAFAIVDVR